MKRRLNSWYTALKIKKLIRHGWCPLCNSSPPDPWCKVCDGSRFYGSDISETMRADWAQKYIWLRNSPPPHVYFSTACNHNMHEMCRKQCKYCSEYCICYCHQDKEKSND